MPVDSFWDECCTVFTGLARWLALLSCLLWSSSVLAQQPHPEPVKEVGVKDGIRRVLLISSYHPGFPTFFRQIEGVRSVFTKVENIRLDIEFMDSKRFGEEAGRKFILDILTAKLEKLPPYDAIMVADDNALTFVLDHQVQLFTDLPIVFFGINNYEKAVQLNSNLLVTGVIESVSMAETIELMLKLRPKAKEVVAIGDSTASGLADLEHFATMQEAFPAHPFRVLSLADYTFSEFGKQLAKIDDTSAVLLLSAFVDKEGTRLPFDQSLEILLADLHQPLFHLWYHGIGEGLLGGKVISHVEQGRVAAEMVLAILDGADIAGIPVETESPNRVVIDYKSLKSYGIDQRLLPADTVWVNQPRTFYREHKRLVWFVVPLCILQSIVILLLMYFINRKRIAERELRESEERYYALFAKNHSVMVLVDPETVSIVDANPAACSYYGYDRDQLIGKKASEINTLSEVELTEVAKEVGEHKRKQMLFKHRLASGEIRDVEVYSGPIPLKGRRLLCSIIHDVTDRKQLEEQLLQARKMEAIGTLAGGIAHDFNNILAAIIGYVELAKAAQFPGSEVDEYLGNVLLACERARDLIAQILAYGRQDIGLKTPTSMRQVVEETLRLLRASIPATVEIKTDITADECTVDANMSKLHQMILNLCTNACQAMENDQGRLLMKLEKVSLKADGLKDVADLVPGEYVRLSVKDTGTGIDPEIRGRIFDPYFTTKASRKGSGLGLAVVTGIVQSMQGYITLESEKGQGAQFDIYIPVCDRAIPKTVPQQREPLTGRERVLVVDDEPALTDIMDQKLTRLGYVVTTANSAESAWRMIESDPYAFDLVLTDQTMPELTGEILARRIKRLRADIPVIISSGYTSKIDLSGDEPFVDSILNKPVDDRMLASTLRALLDKYASVSR